MLKFFTYEPEIKNEWDDFVLSHDSGSVHQVSAWKDFQTQIPGRGQVFGFGVKKNEKIVATTWCVRMEMGKFGKFWYYSARGPVVDFEKDKDAFELLVSGVSEKLKTAGGVFWRLDPYWKKSLKGNFKTATQDYQPTDTRMIDLTVPEEEILSQMKQRGRRFVRKAEKAGIEIEAISGADFTDQDLEDYHQLNAETTERDGFSGHDKDYYKNFLSHLSDYTVLFFATHEGKRIASAISTFCGDKAIYYFGASTSDRELGKLNAPSLLQWEMMKYGKNEGCKTYDFLGIAPEGVKNHAYSGITQFKDGFGGYRVVYARGAEVVLNSMWYSVYRVMKKLR